MASTVRNLVVLTGAGVSAESGLAINLGLNHQFRDYQIAAWFTFRLEDLQTSVCVRDEHSDRFRLLKCR